MADTNANLIQPKLEPKPEPKTSSQRLVHINLNVVDTQTGNVMQLRIKTTTTLKHLMATYCERRGLDKDTQGGRFHYDGRRVRDYDTVLGLGMEEGDTVEVYQEQTGGGLEGKLWPK